jgi:hypothetical protein
MGKQNFRALMNCSKGSQVINRKQKMKPAADPFHLMDQTFNVTWSIYSLFSRDVWQSFHLEVSFYKELQHPSASPSLVHVKDRYSEGTEPFYSVTIR